MFFEQNVEPVEPNEYAMLFVQFAQTPFHNRTDR